MLKQLLLAFCFVCSAWGASLEWNASVVDDTHAAPTGYRIHRGPAPGAYDWSVDVGNVLQWPIPDDLFGAYYWAASAYNDAGSSGYSNEVYFTRDAPPVYVGAVNLRASKLQQEQIMADTALYTAAIAVYDFENNANDTKGSLNLTANNTPTYSTTGEAQGTYCAALNGTNQYFSHALNSAYNFTSDYSVSFWVEFDNIQYYGGLLEYYSKLNWGNGWSIQMTYDGNNRIKVIHRTNYTGTVATFSTRLTTGTRYHIVLIYSDSGNTITAYVSTTSFGNIINGTTVSMDANPGSVTADADFYIGRVLIDDLYHDGKIDEVVLWNSAITSANASAIFGARDGGTSWRETGGGSSAVPVIMRSYRARRN